MTEWTVEEARAYLPRLERLIVVIRQGVRVSARARSNGHVSPPPAGRQQAQGVDTDDVSQSPSHTQADGGSEDTLEAMTSAAAVAELEDRGIVLRDVEQGLVDFPCRHPGGKTVLLCWRLGEPDLAWWHLPEDGFAGRRPLPLPPEI
ncbi:MAG TPA: DUF2203 domain-containing protein [Acidimicrobiales bacterium]|nr:DUF2203 domain-containing protein [Acidimicrobiales bacterium]